MFNLKNKETKLTPNFWYEKAKTLQEELISINYSTVGSWAEYKTSHKGICPNTPGLRGGDS